MEKPHISVRPCFLRTRAIFSDDVHEVALLLAADQTPLMLSAICYRQLRLLCVDVLECRRRRRHRVVVEDCSVAPV